MRRTSIPILALLLAATPLVLTAQQPGMQQRMQQRAPMAAVPGAGMAERLIEHREQLGLSVDQVAQIRRIQAELETRNQPLVARLREDAQAQRGAMREQQAAMRERMAGMTDEQRAEARARMREEMAGRRQAMRQDGERPRMPPAARRPALQRDSTQAMRMRALGMDPETPMTDGMRDVMEQVRENTRLATEQMMGTLTAEQRATLATLRRRDPGDRPGPARR